MIENRKKHLASCCAAAVIADGWHEATWIAVFKRDSGMAGG
jgi:hypothetical protein